MCGIFGILFANGVTKLPENRLNQSSKLSELISHREPDGYGVYSDSGIEARFPFLDESLVETAIDLPLHHKIRFSPVEWEKGRPFLRAKWVIRKVVDRYLPKLLSQRKKCGFDVNAFRRMTIDKQFFDSGFITNQFKLSKNEVTYLFETAGQPLMIKFMMLEVWGRVFMEGAPLIEVQQGLQSSASIRSLR